MNIHLNEESKFSAFHRRLHSKTEDIFFSFMLKLPENLIPKFLMNWMNNYIEKQITLTRQQIIRDKWKQVAFDSVLEKIHQEPDKK